MLHPITSHFVTSRKFGTTQSNQENDCLQLTDSRVVLLETGWKVELGQDFVENPQRTSRQTAAAQNNELPDKFTQKVIPSTLAIMKDLNNPFDTKLSCR